MSRYQTIVVHAAAPSKPAWGVPCNGCGVCCLAEPCPLGRLVTLRRQGPCRALRWNENHARYDCGLTVAMSGPLRQLVLRWIAAGKGCDSDAGPVQDRQA